MGWLALPKKRLGLQPHSFGHHLRKSALPSKCQHSSSALLGCALCTRAWTTCTYQTQVRLKGCHLAIAYDPIGSLYRYTATSATLASGPVRLAPVILGSAINIHSRSGQAGAGKPPAWPSPCWHFYFELHAACLCRRFCLRHPANGCGGRCGSFGRGGAPGNEAFVDLGRPKCCCLLSNLNYERTWITCWRRSLAEC